MIQDIENSFINHYEQKPIGMRDKVIIFRGKEILIKQDNDNNDIADYMTYEEFKEIKGGFNIKEYSNKADSALFRFIFTIDEISYFLVDYPKEGLGELDGLKAKNFTLKFIPMFALRSISSREVVFAGATAWHVYHWYHNSRFCGVCGNKLVHDDKERMMKCPVCGNMVFPRLVPAVIVGVRDEDRLVMTKYVGREYKRYALIAGFTEIGETIEETVAREVMEEVGLKVKNITYYKSQPWGFDDDLLLGFYCDIDGADSIKMDGSELSVAEWVDYKDIPEYNEGLSLTEEMMKNFKRQREKYHECRKQAEKSQNIFD
jgi:NAD+ diphosphatase